jgi:hypothetical protein
MAKKRFFSSQTLLVGILLLALVVRLWQIGSVPAGITHDELDYYLGGKFLGLTGSDFTGTWKWWTLSPMNQDAITAELTPVFFVPAATLFPSSLLTAKLTTMLFGSGMVLLMYWFLVIISKGNKRLGLIGAGIMALNPWSIIYSRTAYEVTISLFWYFLSITAYLSINLDQEKKKKLISRLFLSAGALFLGYFSYHGFKFLVPFIAVVEVIGLLIITNASLSVVKKRWQFLVAPLLLAAGLLCFSYFRSPILESRSIEINFMHIDSYADQVNTDRRLTLSNALTPVLQNKYTLYGKDVLSTYFDLFSFNRLFVAAKDGYTLSFYGHGYFYFIEIIFLLLGVVQIGRKKSYWILILLALIAPIPSIIHVGSSYALRSQLLIIPIVGFAAIGIDYIISYCPKWKIVSVLVLYLLSFIYFEHVYFNQNSVRSADQYMIQYRVASSYLQRLTDDKPVFVLTALPQGFFRTHMFYADTISRKVAKDLQIQFSGGFYSNYSYKNLLVTDDCELLEKSGNDMIIVEMMYAKSCIQKADEKNILSDKNYISIGSPIDSREYYRIYNPALCDNDLLPPYIKINNLKQLSIENLTNQDFCASWLFHHR